MYKSDTDFLRFTFALELDERIDVHPQDSDIARGLWLTLEE